MGRATLTSSSTLNSVARRFSLIELLVVVTIIAILMALFLPSLPETIPWVPETQAQLATIELAMEQYKTQKGDYPFKGLSGNINLTHSQVPEIREGVLDLLRIEGFETNKEGMPVDHWGHPIYLILSKDYATEGLAKKRENLAEDIYYRPRSFQLISGGPDGSDDGLGHEKDNIYNFKRE